MLMHIISDTHYRCYTYAPFQFQPKSEPKLVALAQLCYSSSRRFVVVFSLRIVTSLD